MSQPDLESVSMPSIINKKPRYDVYFVMLVVSLIAILMGCLFLYLEIRAYGGFGQIKGALSAVSPALSDPIAQYWA
ncbi:MAG: hypothetical protein SH868_04775 [Bythopirellula sp.]|nr:hypothetical protein [Bythopirellula sp.]